MPIISPVTRDWATSTCLVLQDMQFSWIFLVQLLSREFEGQISFLSAGMRNEQDRHVGEEGSDRNWQ